MNTTARTVFALAASAALLPLSAAATSAVPAKDDGRAEVRVSGDCSARSDWKLKAKERDGGLEVEFEVDSNRNGQTWTYAISRNGAQFAQGNRRTVAPSGSFEVERRTVGNVGPDSVTARAQNARNGEVCLATLSI